MNLDLGDMISSVKIIKLSYEELQKIEPESDKNFCGLYMPEQNTIYLAEDYKNIDILDILLHEIGHLIIDELKLYKSEEHKADILAIRLKNLLREKKKIYAICRK